MARRSFTGLFGLPFMGAYGCFRESPGLCNAMDNFPLLAAECADDIAFTILCES